MRDSRGRISRGGALQPRVARAEFPRGVVGDGGTRSWAQNTSRLIAATTEFHPVGVMWISIHAVVCRLLRGSERGRAPPPRHCTTAAPVNPRAFAGARTGAALSWPPLASPHLGGGGRRGSGRRPLADGSGAAGRLGLAAGKPSHREKQISFQNKMTGLSQKKYHPGNDPEQACKHRCLIESIATAAD